MPLRWTLAGKQIGLVVAVEMHLIGRAAEVLAGFQLIDNVRVPAAAMKVGNQSSPEKMPFSTLPAETWPGQRMMQGTRKPPS